MQLQQDLGQLFIDRDRNVAEESLLGLHRRKRAERDYLDPILVGRKHWRIAVHPLVVDKCVYHSLLECLLTEQHYFFALDLSVALVGLRDIQSVSEIKHLIQRQQQAHIAVFSDGIHSRGLVLAVEYRKTDRDMRVVGKELCKHIVLSVLGQQFEVLLEGRSVQFDALGLVVQEQLVKGELIEPRFGVEQIRQTVVQHTEKLSLTFGVFAKIDLA